MDERKSENYIPVGINAGGINSFKVGDLEVGTTSHDEREADFLDLYRLSLWRGPCQSMSDQCVKFVINVFVKD